MVWDRSSLIAYGNTSGFNPGEILKSSISKRMFKALKNLTNWILCGINGFWPKDVNLPSFWKRNGKFSFSIRDFDPISFFLKRYGFVHSEVFSMVQAIMLFFRERKVDIS